MSSMRINRHLQAHIKSEAKRSAQAMYPVRRMELASRFDRASGGGGSFFNQLNAPVETDLFDLHRTWPLTIEDHAKGAIVEVWCYSTHELEDTVFVGITPNGEVTRGSANFRVALAALEKSLLLNA